MSCNPLCEDYYKSAVALFLLAGLVLVSLTLTVYYDIPQLNLGLHLHTHKSVKLKQTDQCCGTATHCNFLKRYCCRDLSLEQGEDEEGAIFLHASKE